jgi:hypothetical protein
MRLQIPSSRNIAAYPPRKRAIAWLRGSTGVQDWPGVQLSQRINGNKRRIRDTAELYAQIRCDGTGRYIS